jgi:hypothetical protein
MSWPRDYDGHGDGAWAGRGNLLLRGSTIATDAGVPPDLIQKDQVADAAAKTQGCTIAGR